MEILPAAKNKKGHYSPGVVMNGTLYISGQLPIDPLTGKLAGGDIETQGKQSLKNVEQVLQQAGVKKENVGLCRIYLSDISLWDKMNAIYAEFFGSHKPARVIVPTGKLHYGALVEIEAAAEMPDFIKAN